MEASGADQAIDQAEVRAAFRALANEAAGLVASGGSDADYLRRGIPYYDTQKDQRIRELAAYDHALHELGKPAVVQERYGDANRLLLAFAYGFLERHSPKAFDETIFDQAWMSFLGELEKDVWSYYGVANVHSFDGDSALYELADDVSIRHRNFEELRDILGWGDHELAVLTDDWMQSPQASSYIIMVRQDIPKEAENVVLSGGPQIDVRLQRMILALRLLKSGALGTGPTIHARPSAIRLSGGVIKTSIPHASWRLGTSFHLAASECAQLNDLYIGLKEFDSMVAGSVPHITLALRRFSMSYEREFSQPDDRVVDVTTALEALLLRENDELSFRLSYRGSSILAAGDDERKAVFDTLRSFYSLRSKIVHGMALKQREVEVVQNSEPLHDVLRRLLRAFMNLALTSLEFRSSKGQQRFYERLDRSLLLQSGRPDVRNKMGLEGLGDLE